jgi:hypothetical protein
MAWRMLFMWLLSFSAHAEFERILIQNLDLSYLAPMGKGTVEKVGIGMSLASVPYEVVVERTDHSFELTSPYVDFSWEKPLAFIYDLKAIETKKLNMKLGGESPHFIEADSLLLKTGENQLIKASQLKAKCQGLTRAEFEIRLLEDCTQQMELTIKKIEIPINKEFMRSLPKITKSSNVSSDNVRFKMNQGSFSLDFFMNYILTATLRSRGKMHFEDEYKTLVIKIDDIKFGPFRVTQTVMKKLKEMIKDPRIKVTPPFIRINYGAIIHGESI